MCELSDHMASFATANVFLKHVVTEKTKTKSQGSRAQLKKNTNHHNGDFK